MYKYLVTCEKCQGHDEITITEDNKVSYREHTPIVSARFRSDNNWGFECICGQDSRVAPQEKDKLSMLVKGGEHMIEAIKRTLTKDNHLKFRMERM